MTFANKVYVLTKKIPKGRISTYKIIAEKLGTKAYRAVGIALSRNPTPIIVPCHRIVKSNGELGGFTSDKYDKKALLMKKGMMIKNNKIINFEERLFYFR